MKKSIVFILILVFSVIHLIAKDKTAYVLYSSKGKKVSFQKMADQLAKCDIILFGELHNNPIAHWLQYEVVESLHHTRQIILGAEMFESDNQQALTDYIQKRINKKALDSLARLWPNYKTDYAPLVNFARDSQLSFIATNIPRKFANLVYKSDFKALDSLTDTEKSWIAPLPIEYDPELPGYAGMRGMMNNHSGETLPKAQAIKDATMAHFITTNYREGSLFIHFNGAYHSDNHEGILWYLKRLRPELNYLTITTVSVKDPAKPEEKDLKSADFIICIDENMTTTY